MGMSKRKKTSALKRARVYRKYCNESRVPPVKTVDTATGGKRQNGRGMARAGCGGRCRGEQTTSAAGTTTRWARGTIAAPPSLCYQANRVYILYVSPAAVEISYIIIFFIFFISCDNAKNARRPACRCVRTPRRYYIYRHPVRIYVIIIILYYMYVRCVRGDGAGCSRVGGSI